MRLALLTSAAVFAVAAAACGGTPDAADEQPDPTPDAQGETADDTTDGDPVSMGGMCVEMYSPETLASREFAFAGTVEAVDGDDMTLTVSEWYWGGDAASITLSGAAAIGGLTPDATVDLSVGAELLVSGDDTFAWSCGFTQAYDADVAAEWAAAVG